MTPPYYTATLASLSRGWSYTSTDGDVPSGTLPVYLADDWSLTWGFENEQVPGQLLTQTFKFRLYARNVGDLPVVDRGDLVTLDLRIGAAGSRIAAPPPFQVTECVVDVDPELVNDPNVYAATAEVTAVDQLSYLRTVQPTSGTTPLVASPYESTFFLWRPRFAQYARQIGVAIGCPTWWGDQEGPLYPLKNDGSHFQNISGLIANWEGSGFDIVTRELNSHHPGGWTHTIVPGYQSNPATWPAGWRRVGPDTWWGDNDFAHPEYAISEPVTSFRYYLQPASRKTPTTELPLRFVMSGATLTVERTPPTAGGGHSRGAVDAAWCDLPVSLRRSREHRVNDARLLGWEQLYAPGSGSSSTPGNTTAGVRDYADNADIAARNLRTVREIPTNLFFGEVPFPTNPTFDVNGREHPIVGPNYLADSSQDSSWVFDEFKLYASRIPDAYAADLLPKLTPRAAGETDGDAMVLRHLTVYRASPRSLPSDVTGPISGFIVTGRLRIVDGDLEWTLTLTPGLPVRTGAATTPVTVGEVQAAAYGNTTNPNIDPYVRVGELDYIDA